MNEQVLAAFSDEFVKIASVGLHAAEVAGLGVLAAPHAYNAATGKTVKKKTERNTELAGLGILAAPSAMALGKGVLKRASANNQMRQHMMNDRYGREQGIHSTQSEAGPSLKKVDQGARQRAFASQMGDAKSPPRLKMAPAKPMSAGPHMAPLGRVVGAPPKAGFFKNVAMGAAKFLKK